mmetsp:Transcript_2045/g.7985  ORF Transcript_2045/g.7985 Transcript_2045/m.7985 type:complete len:214 (+) Transcript_2045:1415-2056(+)
MRLVDAFGHSEWYAGTSRGTPVRGDARGDARVTPRPDARAIFVARGRARDGTVRVPRARRVPRETDASRIVVHTYFVDRSRLVSLEGGSPRPRDVTFSRSIARRRRRRTSTVQSAKKHALNTEKPRITRPARAAGDAAADRSIATIVGSSRDVGAAHRDAHSDAHGRTAITRAHGRTSPWTSTGDRARDYTSGTSRGARRSRICASSSRSAAA